MYAVKIRLDAPEKKFLYTLLGFCGVVFFAAPLYTIIFNTQYLIEYATLLPFIAMIFVTDSINFFLKGNPLIKDFYRFNPLIVFSIIIAWILTSVGTELLNLFAKEWEYTLMPLSYIKIASVPLAVFIGWFPLIIAPIAAVRLIKRIDFIKQQK